MFDVPSRMGGEEHNHLKVQLRLGYTLVLGLFSVITNTLGKTVVAVDINDEKFDFAKSIGIMATVNALKTEDVVQSIIYLTEDSAHIRVYKPGSPATCFSLIVNLRKRGEHIQAGLMLAKRYVGESSAQSYKRNH